MKTTGYLSVLQGVGSIMALRPPIPRPLSLLKEPQLGMYWDAVGGYFRNAMTAVDAELSSQQLKLDL